MPELELPDHIFKTADGQYWSSRTNRQIPDDKIQEICDKFFGRPITPKPEKKITVERRETVVLDSDEEDAPEEIDFAPQSEFLDEPKSLPVSAKNAHTESNVQKMQITQKPNTMNKKIEDVRDILFEQLERLKNARPEQIKQETERSQAMIQVSHTIIESAKAETDFLRVVGTLQDGNSGTGFISKQIEN